MGFLDGKVAFITGAARGQGRAHAVTSAREGADVILVDIGEQMKTVPYAMATDEDMATTVREVEALGRHALSITADVRSQAELDEAVSRGIGEFGHIDILIANAGIWTTSPFWELSEDAWDEMIGVNLTGVWKSAKAVARHMIERQTGSIVITASTNGLEPGLNYAHYVSAKHGVIGLMKNIALELAPHGVRCNAICPGAILTPMTNHQDSWDMISGHEEGTEAEMIEFGYHFGALKQHSFLAPQVIADTALYLNSELAAAVTGVTIPVDAGHTLLAGFNHSPVK
jgi:SDR family mycofactocin-dependent oxidoreductase